MKMKILLFLLIGIILILLSGCIKQEKVEYIGGKFNVTITGKEINYTIEGKNYSGYIEPKFRASLDWIKQNIPDNAKFLS